MEAKEEAEIEAFQNSILNLNNFLSSGDYLMGDPIVAYSK